MGNRFASGRKALGMCDICGQEYLLKRLKTLVVKLKPTNMLVCPQCWTPDQPQLQLGMRPVYDPQGLRNPRPDSTYLQAGMTGLQVSRNVPPDNVLAFGGPSGGSRVIQWGWNPVGLNNVTGLPGLVDVMEMRGEVGSVTIDLTSTIALSSGVESIGAVGDVAVVTNVATPLSTSGVSAIGTVTVVIT